MSILDAIEQSGAKLESATQHLDTSTPEGRFRFAILASAEAFRSRGDGEKVKAGLQRKHASGGTPGVAPVGYLNTIEMYEGRAVRTVMVDPDRAPLVKLAFDAYASGEHTVSSLTNLLRAEGLRTVARGSRPSRPVARSYVHKLLRNPYYIGIVDFNGVRYPGRHEPLIDTVTFDRVQDRLAASALAGDRSRKHQHYLKGSVFCGQCGGMLSSGRHRNGIGVQYEYFGCVARRSCAAAVFVRRRCRAGC